MAGFCGSLELELEDPEDPEDDGSAASTGFAAEPEPSGAAAIFRENKGCVCVFLRWQERVCCWLVVGGQEGIRREAKTVAPISS